jgi:hypothetical protein
VTKAEPTQLDSSTDIVSRLEAALPVDDVLAFVLAARPGVEREALMDLMSAVYAAGFEIVPAEADEPSLYRVGEHELRAFPQRVLSRRSG